MYPWGGEEQRKGGSGLGEKEDGRRGKRKAQAWGRGLCLPEVKRKRQG